MTQAFSIAGRTPGTVAAPATIDELRTCVAAAHAAGLTIIPAGNGTQLARGRAPRAYDIAVSTRRLNRIVAHEAADMTVTVEAGLTLAELNAALAASGQWLPLDPPHPEHTTIGALIATDACGPHRLAYGKVRDLLIGITVALADGTLVKGGGRVVKNVAGYDLMKLLIGSFGTLGIVAEATFKVRPRPERHALLVVPAAGIAAAMAVAQAVLAAPLSPAHLEVLNAPAARAIGLAGAAVIVGCDGLAAEIDVQRRRLEDLAEAAGLAACGAQEGVRLYAALRDLPADARFAAIATISVLPALLAELLADIDRAAAAEGLGVGTVSHVGNGAVVLGTATANAALVAFAEWLLARVRRLGGWLRFDRIPAGLAGRIDPWPMDPPGLELMRGIKQTLDPQGRLSPGRFVGGI